MMNKIASKKASITKRRSSALSPRSSKIRAKHLEKLGDRKEPQDESLTALPVTIDISALAELYNSPPVSRLVREDLLEEARGALMKYELAEADLEIAADSLARTMHMLLEQHGLKKLNPEHMAALERHVLDYCGLCQPESIPEDRPAVEDRSESESFTPDREVFHGS